MSCLWSGTLSAAGTLCIAVLSRPTITTACPIPVRLVFLFSRPPHAAQMSVGQSHPSASGKGSGESIAVSSILHQVLLLAGDFRTAPDWAETVTMDTSPVLKAGFLMYKEAKGNKDFREFASKSFPTSPSPLASVNCCSSVSFVD